MQGIRDPAQECLGLAEAKILEQRLDQLAAQQAKEPEDNRQAHTEFYRRLEYGERSMAVTQAQLAQILADTGEIKDTVNKQSEEIASILQKPAKHWEAIVAALIAGAVGFLLKSAGIF